MRVLVHLSDLHFGSIRHHLIEPMLEAVEQVQPTLIAVSGDLTQRARSAQFRAARAFLDRLSARSIVVPGNHDVPLFNLVARFRGLAKYRRYVQPDLEPVYKDGEIVVIGINTARALAWKGGRINRRQADRTVSLLTDHHATLTKIVVTHHPFDLPETYHRRALVGRARMAIAQLNKCGIDLYLAGHYHIGSAAPTAFQVPVNGYSSVIVQAGTALSDRTRGEPNSFNVIRIDSTEMCVERHDWNVVSGAFLQAETSRYQRTANGWSRAASQ